MRTRLVALLLALAAAPAAADDAFKVVVHPSNKGAAALGRAELSKLFLKKSTRWPDGKEVQPVEPAETAVRERFARKVLDKSPMAVKAYWNQQIFAGRDVPPLEKPSDAEVVAYVRQNPGAVGYVSVGADTSGLLVIPLRD